MFCRKWNPFKLPSHHPVKNKFSRYLKLGGIVDRTVLYPITVLTLCSLSLWYITTVNRDYKSLHIVWGYFGSSRFNAKWPAAALSGCFISKLCQFFTKYKGCSFSKSLKSNVWLYFSPLLFESTFLAFVISIFSPFPSKPLFKQYLIAECKTWPKQGCSGSFPLSFRRQFVSCQTVKGKLDLPYLSIMHDREWTRTTWTDVLLPPQ